VSSVNVVDVNVAVLAGTLARKPEPRLLVDGTTIWEMDLAIRAPGRAVATVPVSWPEPPPGLDPGAWATGEGVCVVGAVRRRFYRAGGATVSRTDVLATAVVLTRQRKQLIPWLSEALEPLCSVEPWAGRPRGDRLRGHG